MRPRATLGALFVASFATTLALHSPETVDAPAPAPVVAPVQAVPVAPSVASADVDSAVTLTVARPVDAPPIEARVQLSAFADDSDAGTRAEALALRSAVELEEN
jgi:hypothetical protein